MSDHQIPQLSLVDKNKANGYVINNLNYCCNKLFIYFSHSRNTVTDSPKPIKRFPSTEVPPSVLLSPYKQLTNGNISANTSPLLLQRFYHQQNQHHSR